MADSTLRDLLARLTDLETALNVTWVLIAAILVMFMQAGFALVECGLTRSKNVAHTMAMNFLAYSVGIIGYWAVGFGLHMGGLGPLTTLGGDATLSSSYSVTVAGREFGLFGASGFFLSADAFTPAVATLFLFQAMFMTAGCTIPTGALAERWKYLSFVLFSFVMSTVIYPVYAHWVWGGGWLSALGGNYALGHGHVDFAGSSVVHLTGGVAALVGARLLGPRLGKFGPDGTPRAIPGHNLALTVTGTFVLAFGWFGFNAGSTLAATDLRTAIVAVNTMLSSAAGALAATIHTWRRFGKPDPTWMCNGMLAGLVAITGPCAFVDTTAAVFIGAVAGLLVVGAATFVEERLGIDDPVGAIAVHGANGAWGILALGLFANGSYGDGLNGVSGGVRGLFYGDSGQFFASLIGIAANVLYVGGMTALAFTVLGKVLGGNRVSVEDEIDGLDVAELGVEGYATEGPAPAAESARSMPSIAVEVGR